MWQRKQTLFLLIAGVLVALLYWVPALTLTIPTDTTHAYILDATGVHTAQDYSALSVLSVALSGIIVLLTLVVLCLFKKRKLQARMTLFTLLLVIALLGVMVFNAISFINTKGAVMTLSWGGILFPASILFYYLAIRGIVADEILVRSVDRLR